MKSPLAATNISEAKFKAVMRCADCGKQLNETHEMTAEQLYKSWTQIVLSGGLQAGKCPEGCRSTFSDMNINTGLTIVDVATGTKFELQAYKFLSGHFYQDDYEKVCECKTYHPDEVYISDKYPAVHGVCGKWLQRYQDA